jgi:SAM-dependent methyltransferase
MRAPDFGRLAERYDELRPVDDNWWELFRLLVREGDLRGRRVLELGCGTGRLASALAEHAAASVCGVDTSPKMIAVARRTATASVRWKISPAEALPFADHSFERAVLRLAIHLVDRKRALPELRRVLTGSGRLVVATWDPAYFETFWLGRLFPSMTEIDRERFPAPATLSGELRSAGFRAARVVPLHQRSSWTRAQALERIRGRHISTFDLIDEAEYRAGLERAERELGEAVEAEFHWAVVVADV